MMRYTFCSCTWYCFYGNRISGLCLISTLQCLTIESRKIKVLFFLFLVLLSIRYLIYLIDLSFLLLKYCLKPQRHHCFYKLSIKKTYLHREEEETYIDFLSISGISYIISNRLCGRFQRTCWQMFFKIGVLKNLANFAENQMH